MRILFSFADQPSEWNCSQWRCLSPSDAINKSGKHSAKLLWLDSFCQYDNPAVQDIVGPSDVIIVQRNFITPPVWNAMEYWRGLGKAVITDLDDGYPTLPWSNPAHAFWIENKANLPNSPIELMMEGLKHCDALASPSRVILDDWKALVPGLYIPNYASGAWYRGLDDIRARRHAPSSQPPHSASLRGQLSPANAGEGAVVIGWGGSVSHYDSFWFSGVREALARLCKERPNVFVKICGNDSRMLQQLEIPNAQKINQPGVAPQEWAKIIATFDIGIAPLDLRDGLGSYDQRRSWLKGVEYMLAGVPWIASQSEPYRDLEQFGTVVENGEANWHDALVRMIDNLPEAERRAKRIKKREAWKYTLEQNVENIISQYSKALELRRAGQGLPGVYYIGFGGQAAVGGKQLAESASPVPLMPTEAAEHDLARRRAIQAAAFNASHEWHRGLPLEFAGVNLGERMGYDLIQRFNLELMKASEQKVVA